MSYSYQTFYNADWINPDVVQLLENNNLEPQSIGKISTGKLGDVYKVGLTDLLHDDEQRINIMKAVKEWSLSAPSDPETEKTFSALAIFDETEEADE